MVQHGLGEPQCGEFFTPTVFGFVAEQRYKDPLPFGSAEVGLVPCLEVVDLTLALTCIAVIIDTGRPLLMANVTIRLPAHCE